MMALQDQVEASFVSLADANDVAALALYKSKDQEFTGSLAESVTFSPSDSAIKDEIIQLYTVFQQEQADVIMSSWTELFENILTK